MNCHRLAPQMNHHRTPLPMNDAQAEYLALYVQQLKLRAQCTAIWNRLSRAERSELMRACEAAQKASEADEAAFDA